MTKFWKFKRLKIAEQILIVMFFAVIVPMAISGIVINNVNQHAMRAQLRESAVMIANIISEGVDAFYSSGMPKDVMKAKLFKFLENDNRQIYILNDQGNLIASRNFDEEAFQNTISHLPSELETNEPVIFGAIKNQPLVYLKKSEPEITIIVNTSERVTKKTINDNRFKIILAVLVASASIITLFIIYTIHLYVNIRQLFKGIIAISKGNYERRIRLIKTPFTPYETVFLAFEFNKMAAQIHTSYLQLQENNKELEDLNEFRSNLIDTVSHEFRTPLTSIQGYTSRLLRQDIQIDEEMRIKSLKTIRRQAERLKRMVEDMLAIPDIEGMRIKTNLEPVWLPEIVENSRGLVKNDAQFEIKSDIKEDFPMIFADKDRIEQVIVNLLENAIKYAKEDSQIVIEAVEGDEFAKIYVKNQCEKIDKETLNTLFEKFTRIDNSTTRTTRGTGLGLFIVKGLVEAMNGGVKLFSDDKFGFCVEVKIPLYEEAIEAIDEDESV